MVQALTLTKYQARLHIPQMKDAPPNAMNLFDRTRLRAQRDRFTSEAPEFLNPYVINEICERISMIKREFPAALMTSAVPGLRDQLMQAGSITNPVIMDVSRQRLLSEIGSRVVGDEEALPFANESLSCILSLLSLQFVNDLPGALIQMRRALEPDGVFMAVLLGGASFTELREVFMEAESDLCRGVAPRVAPFCDVRDAGTLLQRAGFALPVCDSDKMVVRYSSVLELMRDLRHFGWANALLDHAPGFLRRDVLARANLLYQQKFADEDGRLRATFQFVWMTGWAPHESQQKPLKPGSAKMRLADALGTSETIIRPGSENEST